MSEDTILSVIFLGMLTSVAIVALRGMIVFIRRRDEFHKVFGFSPPRKSDGELAFQVLQPEIDRVLAGLAQTLDRQTRLKAEREALFQETVRSDDFMEKRPQIRLNSIRGHKEDQAELAERIKGCWRDFDRARFLAKGFEFEVRFRLADYLVPKGRTIHLQGID